MSARGEDVREYYGRFPQLVTAETKWLVALPFAGRIVVDAGCGDGAVLQAVGREHALRLGIGVDTSRVSLVAAKRRNGGGLQWIAASILQLPLPDGSVDDVLSIGVLHYYEHPAVILREYARVVRPGGRVILFVYRPHPVHWFRRRVLDRFRGVLARRLQRRQSDVERGLLMNTLIPPPYWPLSKATIRPLVDACGFRVVRIVPKPTHVPQLLLLGAGGPPAGGWRLLASRALDWLFRTDLLHLAAFGYYVVAERQGRPDA